MLPNVFLFMSLSEAIAFDSVLKNLAIVGKSPGRGQRHICIWILNVQLPEGTYPTCKLSSSKKNLFLDNVNDHGKQTSVTGVNWESSGPNYFISHLVDDIYWANNLLYKGCRAPPKWSRNNDYSHLAHSSLSVDYFSIILSHLMSSVNVPIL